MTRSVVPTSIGWFLGRSFGPLVGWLFGLSFIISYRSTCLYKRHFTFSNVQDHKPSNELERERIQNAGGSVLIQGTTSVNGTQIPRRSRQCQLVPSFPCFFKG